MTSWFVTRHPGAVDWAGARGIEAKIVAHLDPATIHAGDVVMGTLPVHLAAEVCARGARYLHLNLDLPPEARGRDLTADDMDRFGATLTEFVVSRGHAP
jgi:CRISPR-associated protein Csx16